jgi:DNA topoisomerase-2
MPGFMLEFITPIVKVTKGATSKSFFTMPEYEDWYTENSQGKGWNIKYYKGLGTSTSKEAKEYFTRMDLHQKEFTYSGAEEDELIDMAFSKKKADMRKEWLNNFEPGTFLDHTDDKVSFADFINKELILFSQADNIRSIPSLVDGFKPSQRKVLFSCFKRKLKKEIKVAQLAGYVSEHSAYHHGEASLQGTIINMAQNFCGSNNVNLLVPAGQFGTRLLGGKDAASPRYIFTCLDKITRLVFKEDDDELLEYLDDDGMDIEPKFYMPVIPLLLVNGSDGIGTGWSSFVPNFNPRDIIANCQRLIRGEEQEMMTPHYRGFRGEIKRVGAQKFEVRTGAPCCTRFSATSYGS